jgi:hypothetical protein
MYICRLCHNLTVGNINEISIYLSTTTNSHADLLPTTTKDKLIPRSSPGKTGRILSFIALLYLYLIHCHREFPNALSKLCYAFSYLQEATLEQIIYLVDNEYVDLESFEACITSLNKA